MKRPSPFDADCAVHLSRIRFTRNPLTLRSAGAAEGRKKLGACARRQSGWLIANRHIGRRNSLSPVARCRQIGDHFDHSGGPLYRRSTAHLLTRRLVFGGLAVTAAGFAAPSAKAQSDAGPWSERADRILVLKSERKLLLLRGEGVLESFPVALGARPVGPKRFEGDLRTPEGLYYIDAMNPHSRFYRALRISYPNEQDMRQARAAGLPPGGNVEIHGMPNSYGRFDPVAFFRDWTNGCIAVGNRAVERIWARVAVGTPVEIRA